MKKIVRDIIGGIRVMVSPSFWRSFRAYYSPDAVLRRLMPPEPPKEQQ